MEGYYGELLVGLAVVLAALFGKDFVTKLLNNKALDKNKEDNKIVAKKEEEVAVLESKLLSEEQKRAEAKIVLEQELKREVNDKEIDDFFRDRYTGE